MNSVRIWRTAARFSTPLKLLAGNLGGRPRQSIRPFVARIVRVAAYPLPRYVMFGCRLLKSLPEVLFFTGLPLAVRQFRRRQLSIHDVIPFIT